MVGHHTHAHVIVVGRAGLRARSTQAVTLAAHLHRSIDDGEDLVDLVHVRLVLHDKREALQSSTGIDRLLVEFAEQRVVLTGTLAAHVLVEHQVPHLEVAVASRVHGATHGLGTVGGAAVVVPLGAGAGRAGLTRVPEVLHTGQAHDVLGVHADLLRQDVEGFLVLVPNRHPESVTVEAVLALVARAGQQVPGEVDGAFLEVIAEGEVAVHLEERTVTGRLADVVNVVGTDALLYRRSPGPRSRLNAHDVGNERNHAGDGKEDRRLRGNQ